MSGSVWLDRLQLQLPTSLLHWTAAKVGGDNTGCAVGHYNMYIRLEYICLKPS